MPSLPRPLLIVLVILIVLGVIGCGVSVGLNSEQDMNDDDQKVELDGGIANFLKRFAPPSAPVALEEITTNCTVSSGNFQVSGSCSVGVPATDAARRRLLLRPTSGTVLMQVTVTHDGDANSDSTFVGSNSDDGSVVLTRGDSAQILLTCSCLVLVNP